MSSDVIKMADYSSGDSSSLKEIDGKPFTIVDVEQSNYDDNLGVKFTILEDYNETRKYHTTRIAIVGKFLKKSEDGTISKTELFNQIKDGKRLVVQTEKVDGGKGKNDYFILTDAEQGLKEKQ